MKSVGSNDSWAMHNLFFHTNAQVVIETASPITLVYPSKAQLNVYMSIYFDASFHLQLCKWEEFSRNQHQHIQARSKL